MFIFYSGNESATLIQPRYHDLKILGLGYSVGTSQNGIQAEAIVVRDFEDLKRLGQKVKYFYI